MNSNDKEKSTNKSHASRLATWMCIGIALGLSVGEFLPGNSLLSMTVGMCLGIAVALEINKRDSHKE